MSETPKKSSKRKSKQSSQRSEDTAQPLDETTSLEASVDEDAVRVHFAKIIARRCEFVCERANHAVASSEFYAEAGFAFDEGAES